jgi:hypothetical protein
LLQAKQELANLSAMHAALTSQLQQHGANSGAAAAHSATGNENSVAAGTGSPWSQAETPNQPSTQSSPEDELGQVNQEVIRLYRLCLDLEAQLKQLKAKDAAHMELPTASAASIPTATATAAATASQIPSKADTSTSPLQHLAQSFMPPSLPTASIRDRLRLTKLKTQATQHTASAPTPTPTATAAATASPIPSKADTSTSHSWSLENTLSMDPLPSFGASSLGSLKGREENSATDWPQSTSFPQALNAPALANELRQAQLEMQQLRLEYKKLIVADEVRKIINASLISELAMQKRQTDKLEKLSNEQAEQLKALAALKHTGTEPKKQSAAASPFRPSGSTIKQKPRRLSL